MESISFEYIWHKYHMHISEWIRINQNRMDNSIFYTSYLYCVGCIYIAKENGHKSLMPHIGIVDDAFSVKLICAHPKLPLKGHNIKFWMEEKAFRQEGNSCTSLRLKQNTLFKEDLSWNGPLNCNKFSLKLSHSQEKNALRLREGLN